MLTRIPAVLNAEQVAECRKLLDAAEWVDGRGSAGFMAERVKNNREVPPHHPAARRIGELILGALAGSSP